MLGVLVELSGTVVEGCVGFASTPAGSAVDADSSPFGGFVLGRFREGPIK